VSGSSSVSNVTAGVASGNVAGVGGGVSQSGVSSGVGVAGGSAASVGVNVNNNSSSASSVGAAAVAQTATGTTAAVLASLTNKNSSSSNSSGSGGSVATAAGNAGGPGAGASTGGVGGASGAGGAGSGGGSGSGLVPTNIQMVSQYIQTGLPYYQQPVYSYEELQMMQQRVPHVVSSWRKAKANTKPTTTKCNRPINRTVSNLRPRPAVPRTTTGKCQATSSACSASPQFRTNPIPWCMSLRKRIPVVLNVDLIDLSVSPPAAA